MQNVKLKIAALVVAGSALGALFTPAHAMTCIIDGQPQLSQTCQQVIGVACGALHKFGGCL